MNHRFFKVLLAALTLTFLVPAPVLAHGSSFSFKYVDGSNIIMITHNVHDLQSGIPISYNARLYDMEGKPVPFSIVQVEFKQGAKLVNSQVLNHSANNDVSLIYTYPDQGEYTLITRFLDNDKQVARGEFPVIVEKGLDDNLPAKIFSMPAILAFLLGIAVVRLPALLSPFIQSLRQKSKTKVT